MPLVTEIVCKTTPLVDGVLTRAALEAGPCVTMSWPCATVSTRGSFMPTAAWVDRRAPQRAAGSAAAARCEVCASCESSCSMRCAGYVYLLVFMLVRDCVNTVCSAIASPPHKAHLHTRFTRR
jgi:hypothetical protein